MDLIQSIFGRSFIVIYIYLGFLTLNIGVQVYAKLSGPSETLSTAIFNLPMLLAFIFAITPFFSDQFWKCFFILTVAWMLYMAHSFFALKATLDDPTGVGAIMFPTLVGMMILFGSGVLKLILALFTKGS